MLCTIKNWDIKLHTSRHRSSNNAVISFSRLRALKPLSVLHNLSSLESLFHSFGPIYLRECQSVNKGFFVPTLASSRLVVLDITQCYFRHATSITCDNHMTRRSETRKRKKIDCYFLQFMMLRIVFLFVLVAFASSSLKRSPRLSDPLALGGLGWELEELQAEDYVKGSVWPKPQGETPSGAVYALSSQNFKFTIVGQSSDVLEQAVTRYTELTFPDKVSETKRNLPQITQLNINVINKYENLTLESDESCK